MPQVTFGIFADLHVDIMHDCQKRLEIFLDDCRKKNVDFIIQLGDFCYPDEKRECICEPEKRPVNIENAMHLPTYADKHAIVEMYRSFEKPSYHCFGNHDLDMCSKQHMYEFLGNMDRDYYSFDQGGVHFVVLDPCYFMEDGQYKPFDNGLYFNRSYDHPAPLPYLPPEQIAWLEKDLAETPYPSVLFSHQGLRPAAGNIRNADDVMPILAKAPNRVILAANGHLHKSTMTRIGDTWFWNVNSMSNLWMGEEYECKRYSDEIEEKFPNIRYTAPYADPLYAIVTIGDGYIDIQGTKSRYVGPSPAEMHYPMPTWDDIQSAEIHSFQVSY